MEELGWNIVYRPRKKLDLRRKKNLNETLPFLNDQELEIYKMKNIEKKNMDQISSITGMNISEIQEHLSSMEKKAELVTTQTQLYSLVTNYIRIMRVALAYYQEEMNNIGHVFTIDYSDLHLYLNPQDTRKQDLDSIGFVFYMFNEKTSDYKYCMLPPATWELLNHLYKLSEKTKTLSSFEVTLKANKRINEFFEIVKFPQADSLLYEQQLMRCYRRMGGWAKVLSLAHQEKLEPQLKTNLSILKRMTDEKILLPLEDVAEESEWKEDDGIFHAALSELNQIRPRSEINNKIDALNMAITYGLTEGYRDKIRYRLVSHSRLPSQVFGRIKFDNQYLSCCPQFLSMLILFNKGLAAKMGIEDIPSRIKFLQKSINLLEDIKHECLNFQFPQRFTSEEFLQGEKIFLTRAFEPVYIFLSNYYRFQKEIYTPLVMPIMSINSGSTNYHSKADIEAIKGLLSNAEKYENTMNAASEAIMQNLKETYQVLYKFLNEKHSHFLTEDMANLLEKIR
jgi:hypothetical protein